MVIQSIYIPHLLRLPGSSQIIPVDQAIANFASLTPVRGQLRVRHGGTFLEVGAEAETIVTLHCDRCAQGYNQKLCLQTKELLWLQRESEEAKATERELTWDDLSEALPPDGHFDGETWLYEQLNLALPLKNLCGKDCQPPLPGEEDGEPTIDQRWAALANLKQQLG